MYTIYHIPGIKVGCTKRDPNIRIKEQGYSHCEILEVCNTIDQASEREIYWQSKLEYVRDNKPYLKTLEAAKLANTESAIKKRKETIKNSVAFSNARKVGIKLLLSHVNYKASRQSSGSHEKPALRKVVLQYTLDNMFIKEWPSIKEAGTTLKLDRGGLSMAARGKYKTYGKYIWKYKI